MLKKVHRLTERHPSGTADLIYKDETYPCHKQWFCPEGDCSNAKQCDYAKLLERLASYEDTRLTPEDILKLKDKVKRLEKQVRDLKEKCNMQHESTV